MALSDFAGGTAVITGAASGIGAALARKAASNGMNLLLADVDEAGLAAVADACPGVRVEWMRVDVSDAANVEEMADRAYRSFGTVELLCNNAGIVPGGRHRPVWEYEPQDWQWAFNVNVIGIANGLRSFVPRMLATRRPANILNTVSISGFISGAGSPVYGASKHAAVRLTEALYASLAERDAPISVSMLCPGLVNTRIFDTERLRPDHLRSRAADVEDPAALKDIASKGADPDDIAAMALDGVARGKFYILTTESFDSMIEDRSKAILSRENPSFDAFASVSHRDARK